ncbi:MAG TPA: M28 family peptidase [Cytophagaceae bacterium]
MKNNINNSQWGLLFLSMLFLFFSCKEEKKKETTTTTEKPVVNVNLPVFNADSAYEYVAAQVRFGPRVPNTPAHRKCGDYLVAKLNQAGAKVYEQEFQARAFNGNNLNLRNIIAEFNPDASKRIIIAAHWDTRPFADQDTINKNKPIDGANDGGSGVGVILELARVLKDHHKDLPFGIDFILFDGEDYGRPSDYEGEGGADTWCLGSQYWSKNKHKSNYAAYYGILLDMVGAKNAKFAMEGTSRYYAPSVVNKVWGIANSLGYSKHFIYEHSPDIIDDHLYVNRIAKIPMIDIIEYDMSDNNYFGSYWHTHDDNMDVIDKSTLKAVGHTLIAVLYNEKNQ